MASTIWLGAALLARGQVVQIAPRSSAEVARYASSVGKAAGLAHDAKVKLLRDKVKYVFVLFQENRSFDFYFAGYPGADGLYDKPPGEVAGFVQPLVNVDGSVGTISPFRIPASIVDARGKTVQLYPMDIASVNHAHVASAKKLDLGPGDIAGNDRYAVTEEGVELGPGGKPNKFPTLARKQMGELVMGHIDCDMAPFLWRYADRFTLFDHFMDTVIGPSTPNAIAMISGQTGETQWMLHPDEKGVPRARGPLSFLGIDPRPNQKRAGEAGHRDRQGRPGDPAARHSPAAGESLEDACSESDLRHAAPFLHGYRHREGRPHPIATPLSICSMSRKTSPRSPRMAGRPCPGVGTRKDTSGSLSMATPGPPTKATSCITMRPSTSAISRITQPSASICMGSVSSSPMCTTRASRRVSFMCAAAAATCMDTNPSTRTRRFRKSTPGTTTTPGYSDSQIAEALLAEEINAIARSPYWKDSVILIAYDETDGLYDHVRPVIRGRDRDGLALGQGPRVPALLISPYGVAHGVSHEPVEHSSIIKLVDELFGLIPLADLPDEARARKIGLDKLGRKDMGPADDLVQGVGDMLSGFDDARLSGKKKPLPGAYAEIPAAELGRFPHLGGTGCSALGITPTDAGRPNPIPPDFNPRPMDSPGVPAAGDWTP